MAVSLGSASRRVIADAPPKRVQIYRYGWTRAELNVIVSVLIAVIIGGAITAAVFAPDHIDSWVLLIGLVAGAIVSGIVYLKKDTIGRTPLVSMSSHGATIPNSGLIPLVALERFLITGDDVQDLYLEMRFPPGHFSKETFRLLDEGHGESEYLWRDSDGGRLRISGRELVEKLDILRQEYQAARGLHGNMKSTVHLQNDVLEKPEIIVFEPKWERVATVILCGSVLGLATLFLWWVLVNALSKDFGDVGAYLEDAGFGLRLTMGLLIGTGVYGAWIALGWLSKSLRKVPTLVVNLDGLRHASYGSIPWDQIRGIYINWLHIESDDNTLYKPVLCAFLTDAYFARRLRWRWDEQVYLLLCGTRKWRYDFKYMLPLVWGFTEQSRRRFMVNGVGMPPDTIAVLTQRIQQFRDNQVIRGKKPG